MKSMDTFFDNLSIPLQSVIKLFGQL